MGMDMRNPYGAEGGYITTRSRRGRRSGRRDRAMDRGMDYAYDRRYYRGGDYEYDSRRGDYTYSQQDMARGRRDYEQSGQSDMARGDYDDDMRRGRDGHHEMRQGGSTYYPIEAMGVFNGYYGMPEDYARGGRGRDRDYADYRYDMNYDYARRGGRYDMRGGRDYGYDYAGDYGENLTKEELEHWKKKLMKELEEKDKQFFSKENISNKAKQMGIEMKGYNEEELEIATLMVYTDYCKTLGTSNMDLYIRLAKDWLEDKDVAVKGGEKLAIYFDCIVEGEE